MKQIEHLKLRDIAQGDFAIRDGCLFYKGKRVSDTGKSVLASEEEAFFLFEIKDADTAREFKHVFLLNCRYPHFYTSIEYKLEPRRFQFISPLNGKNAFRLISFGQSNFCTKIVGDNYYEDGYTPFWRML